MAKMPACNENSRVVGMSERGACVRACTSSNQTGQPPEQRPQPRALTTAQW
jgi:hypothetical protein